MAGDTSVPVFGLERASEIATMEGESILMTGHGPVALSGRVVAISAVRKDLQNARSVVLSGMSEIDYEGMTFRADVGLGSPLPSSILGLAKQNADHMKEG